VLALGRLGAAEFDVFSDADLIFARDEELSHEVATKAVEANCSCPGRIHAGGDGYFPSMRACVRAEAKGKLVMTPAGFLRLLRRRSSILGGPDLYQTALRMRSTGGSTGSFRRHGKSFSPIPGGSRFRRVRLRNTFPSGPNRSGTQLEEFAGRSLRHRLPDGLPFAESKPPQTRWLSPRSPVAPSGRRIVDEPGSRRSPTMRLNCCAQRTRFVVSCRARAESGSPPPNQR